MNDMLSFVLGAGIGAAGTYFINKSQNQGSASPSKVELESLYAENEKLRQRNKDAERQNDDLLAELESLRRKMKSTSENQDDLQDDLEDAKRKVRNLTSENESHKRKVTEYQTACASLEKEVASLKVK